MFASSVRDYTSHRLLSCQDIAALDIVHICSNDCFWERTAKHWENGLRCCAIQVPKRLASPMRVSDPLGLRVPPLILRAITKGRMLRSARLLCAGTPGTATKTNNSGKKRSTRSHKVC